MAQTLAAEYHGHKCGNAPFPIDMVSAYPDLSMKDSPQDAEHDSLYVAGEINRTEWLLHYVRKGERWAKTLLEGKEW